MAEGARKEVAAASGGSEPPESSNMFLYLLQRMDSMEANLRRQIQDVESAIRKEIKDILSSLRNEIQAVHKETHGITRWSIGIFIALIAGFIAVLVPLFR